MGNRSLTSLLDLSLSQLVGEVVDGRLEVALSQLDAVVAEHALRVESDGSRADLLEAAEALHDLAAWVGERGDEAGRLRAATRFELLGEHLTAKAGRSDRAGVDALLRAHDGKPAQLLALLAQAPMGAMARSALAQPLGTGESHVSHILRALYDAGLVHRSQEGRAVTVTISRRGRAAIGTPAAPPRVGSRDFPPGVLDMLAALPIERRRQIEDRSTLAPVIDFPVVAGARAGA